MSDSISTARALINERLDMLRALMTDDPVDGVTERFRAWKADTAAALAGVVVESVATRFDSLEGRPDAHSPGRRATPRVYLSAAATRDFLTALKEDLEADPAAVLKQPPSEPAAVRPPSGFLRIFDLLERRLSKAFRVGPATELDLQCGFETLLAGAEVPYERGAGATVPSSGVRLPDFTFPGIQTAIALKLCDGLDRERQIVTDIHEDIAAWGSMYPRLIFGIYDLGFIEDAARFAEMFDPREGVSILVLRP